MAADSVLQLQTFIEHEIGLIEMSGRLVAESRHELRSTLRIWEDSGPHFVVACMRDLEYIDSAGLAALIGQWKRLNEQGGEMVLADVNPSLKALFEISSLEKFFKIFPDIPGAAQHLVLEGRRKDKEASASITPSESSS